MFYKVKNISKQSGKGTVSVIYRQPDFEILRSTGAQVRPEDFDTRTGKVKTRVFDHPELNTKIHEVVSKLEKAARDVRARHGMVTKELLAQELLAQELGPEGETTPTYEPPPAPKRREPRNNTMSLATRIAAYIKANPEHRRTKTLQGYQDTLEKLLLFSAGAALETVDLKFFQEFQSYLVGQGMRNGSVRTHLDRFKKLYKTLADEANLPYPFLRRFRLIEELADENVISLSEGEIRALEALPLRSLRQRQIRAQFLFSCEVGLRHSDLYITRANVLADTLRVVMRKGKRTVKPPLSARARAILAGEYFPFQRVCINQYNNTIQAICRKLPGFHVREVFTHFVGNNPVVEECARWEAITSHVGRKTAINRWLNQGVRESVVARWAGHRGTKMIEKHYQNYEAATELEIKKL